MYDTARHFARTLGDSSYAWATPKTIKKFFLGMNDTARDFAQGLAIFSQYTYVYVGATQYTMVSYLRTCVCITAKDFSQALGHFFLRMGDT